MPESGLQAIQIVPLLLVPGRFSRVMIHHYLHWTPAGTGILRTSACELGAAGPPSTVPFPSSRAGLIHLD